MDNKKNVSKLLNKGSLRQITKDQPKFSGAKMQNEVKQYLLATKNLTDAYTKIINQAQAAVLGKMAKALRGPADSKAKETVNESVALNYINQIATAPLDVVNAITIVLNSSPNVARHIEQFGQGSAQFTDKDGKNPYTVDDNNEELKVAKAKHHKAVKAHEQHTKERTAQRKARRARAHKAAKKSARKTDSSDKKSIG